MNAIKPSGSPLLVIGSKNYSSWSLRPWLLLRKIGFAFEERIIHFDGAEYQREIAAISPSRRVPVLLVGSNKVWDSLAICEYAVELCGRGLPANPVARAVARSAAAEMHSGFTALRESCPMNVRARGRKAAPSPALSADIERMDALWTNCRRQFGAGGPWLFGDFSIADAMFAPVCFRFQTYGATLSDAAASYLAFALKDPVLLEWQQAAETEGHPLSDVDEVGKL
jgi:glutathione S-transferase